MRFNSRKLCRFLFMFFTGSTSFSVLLRFLLSITRKSSSLLLIFDTISSNIDEVLTISPYIDVFVFGDFNFHNKELFLVELINLVNSATIFVSQMTLLRWLTFLLRSVVVTLSVFLFWICFFPLTLVFVLQWLSFNWEILIVFVSVSIDFLSNSKWDVPFHHIAYDNSCAH